MFEDAEVNTIDRQPCDHMELILELGATSLRNTFCALKEVNAREMKIQAWKYKVLRWVEMLVHDWGKPSWHLCEYLQQV